MTLACIAQLLGGTVTTLHIEVCIFSNAFMFTFCQDLMDALSHLWSLIWANTLECI